MNRRIKVSCLRLRRKISRVKIPLLWKVSFFHSLFLLLMGYFWLGSSYTFEDEALLIKWTTLLKNELVGIGPRPSPEKTLFVNTAGSKVPVNTSADALSLKPAVELITDRQKLAQFMDLLIPFKENIELIVTDVVFDMPAPGDSMLQDKLSRLDDKILAVSFMSENDSIVTPLYQVPYALSTYRSSSDMYFKYPVAYKGNKTVPTVMYEKYSGSSIDKKGLFFWNQGNLILKAPITNFRITLDDFRLGSKLGETNYSVHHLETLINMGQFMDRSDLEKMFAGKLILIGDFSTDIHETVAGPMPGVLVLYNAFLTLVYRDNVLNFGWVLLMIAGFTWITHRILSGKGLYLLEGIKRKFRSGWVHFMIDSIDEILYLAILTLLSYFLFNIHISILILFIYLKIGELIFDLNKTLKKTKT